VIQSITKVIYHLGDKSQIIMSRLLLKDIEVLERTKEVLQKCKCRAEIEFVESRELFFQTTDRLPFDVETALVKEGWTVQPKTLRGQGTSYEYRFPRHQSFIDVEWVLTIIQNISATVVALLLVAIGAVLWKTE
jgi:hypothetical protein